MVYLGSSACIIALCGFSSSVTVQAAYNTAIAMAVQAMYRPFPGRVKLHPVRFLCRPGQRGGPWRHRPRRSLVAAQGGGPPIWAGGGAGESWEGPGERAIVADRFQNFKVAVKVAGKLQP